MEKVYIVEQGTQLHKDGLRLVVKKAGYVIDEVPTGDLEQVVLVGNVMITPAVIDHLIQERVDTVFLTATGRFRGRLLTQYSKNVELRRQQYFKLENTEFKLNLSRQIVESKIKNQRVMLLRYNRNLKNSKIGAACGKIRHFIEDVKKAQSTESLMGLEGIAGKSYFSVFGIMIKREDFSFKGRNKRPPRDPVNALLSFGYTMLANVVETAVNIVGLDPYLGALHTVEYGRPSLVCDLVEEYRAFFVDSLVLTLLNKQVVGPDDFVYRDIAREETLFEGGRIPEEKLPVSMKRETLKGFIKIFEQKMASPVFYEPTGTNSTYRQVILNQVRHFARVILGQDETYNPFVWVR